MTTFATLGPAVPRDRWGRPLIVPVGGGKPVPYTRASTLAKALDNKDALMKWKQRQVLAGCAVRPDLVDVAAAVKDDKSKMNELVEIAMTAAESDRAANVGTALHALTEQVDDGADIEAMPEHFRPDLYAYKAAMAPFTTVAKELFVVTDEVEAAGTFDRLLKAPDGLLLPDGTRTSNLTIVGDVKTGASEPDYPHSATTQIAVYSHGHLYHTEKHRVGHLPDMGVSTKWGLLLHMPAGQAKCDLYWLDLEVGWGLARTAVAVRQVFKSKPLTKVTF